MNIVIDMNLSPDWVETFEQHGIGAVHWSSEGDIRAKDRDRLFAALKAARIGTEIYDPLPLHEQRCFSGLGYKIGDFPASEAASKQTLALPVYPELSEEQQEYVVETLKKFYSI